MSGLLIASPHRYPDLARLWHHHVFRTFVPEFERSGIRVQVLIFGDANRDQFPPSLFPGARLEFSHPKGRRDFVEFYDWVLRSCPQFDRLLFLDADVFILDSGWVLRHAHDLALEKVAAINFLPRNELPGVYALLCRPEVYRALEPPVFAACCEHLSRWPDSVNRGPGESAALRLRSKGLAVKEVASGEAEQHVADFHGTTVVRASRQLFGDVIGAPRFERLISEKRYFAMGAYDNVLLGTLYRAVFGDPFAVANGRVLSGSVTVPALRRALKGIRDQTRQRELLTYFQRSNRAVERLAVKHGVRLRLPQIAPPAWERETT